MKKVLYASLVLLALIAWRDWNNREIVHEAGILVAEPPRQRNLEVPEPLELGEYRLNRRAEFTLRARVLSREDYRWGGESDLSPMDLALGWGVMSDQQVLDRITVTQGGRWYFTRYEYPAPVPDSVIINNSSNMHMIPASSWVRGKLKKIRRGDIVDLKGFLVDVSDESGFTWNTSLSRDDTGNGSCEIFYIEYIAVEEH